jgi:hypothetical protein
MSLAPLSSFSDDAVEVVPRPPDDGEGTGADDDLGARQAPPERPCHGVRLRAVGRRPARDVESALSP